MAKFIFFLKTSLLLVIALVGTSGCGYFIGKDGIIHDSRHDYRSAETLPEITVPSQYGQLPKQELYPIPGLTTTLQLPGEFKAPPPEVFVNSAKSDVRLYKDGNKYWFSTSLPPSDTWSRMRKFWELHDIELDYQRPEQGIFESKWLSRKSGNKDLRDKFRLRVEHGMLRNSSEVYLMHVQAMASKEMPTGDAVDWTQTKDGDPLIEAIIQEMAAFIIQTEYDAASASLLAQRFQGKPKSSLSVDSEGNEYLKLSVDFSRAWLLIGRAIEDANLEKAKDDQEKGIYYVDFYPKTKSSFFKRKLSIFSRSSTKSVAINGFESDLKLGEVRGSKGSAHRIALSLTEDSGQIIVRAFRNADDTDLALGNALIEKIRENLI
jgi:outer membrane protein assembly factor BamC